MKTTRRSFIKLAGSLTIGFTIGNPSPGFSSAVYQELPESLKRFPNINAWLEVMDDGRVRVFTGKLELGQGIRTAIAQVAAEELEMKLSGIEVVLADTARTPDEGYTAGSGSMEQSAMAVRYAAAAAKAKLITLAAEKLKVKPEQLALYNGIVQTKNGRKASFFELLEGKQIADKVSGPVELKSKEKYTLVGRSIPRNDISLMVEGKHVFVQDLSFDGMVHARIVRPPSYRAQLVHLDEEYIKNNSGSVLKLVKNGNFIGVIAAKEYDAIKAQAAIKRSGKWSAAKLSAQNEYGLKEHIKNLPVKSEKVEEKGSMSGNALQLSAEYYKPYQMHGSIGPSCAVALFDKKNLHIWTHSQGVFPLRKALSGMLQLSEENIRVTGVPGSGCYGHNGADDVAADAALLAIAYPGKHVRLQWMRDDEHLWEPYGSAMLMQVSASIGKDGRITEWKYELRSDNHSSRPGGKAGNLLAARYINNPIEPPAGGYSGGAYRNSQPYYRIPNQEVYAHIFEGPLRVSALRSLGAYANIFAIESFIDELAEKAGKDPFEFRRMHQDDPRANDVMEKLEEITRDVKTESNEGFGIAFSRYKNSASYCGVAAKVFIAPIAKDIKVLKMWAVIDAGECINIDGVINQTEGGLIQSASWTIMEEVKFDDNQINSSDWSSYPILRFTDSPEVHVEVINRPHEEVLGAGEAAQGPAAAAIANAVYRACGKRMRDLPISREKLFPETKQ